MRRTIIVTFILIMLLTTLLFRSFIAVKGDVQDVGFIIKMTVTYSNPSNGTRIWNFTEEDRIIGLFMNNTWQTVYLINYSYPLETMKNDEDGNLIAVLSFPKLELKPGENISYTLTYYALSKPRSIPTIIEEKSESLEGIPKDLVENYCKGEGPWLTNDPALQGLAHNIAKNETRVLTIIKKFIMWIRDNIEYPHEMHEVPLYPNETYAKRKGDCDDQAILFTTLCRIVGIPSYLQIGCIYLSARPRENETYWDSHVSSVLKWIGWHGWAMVHIPPWGWLPVDLTYLTGGLGDPLNAIKTGAVTLQETIQYMNLTQTDYVASSRRARDFLRDNDFYVYMEDEMILGEPQKPPVAEISPGWPHLTFVIMITATVAGVSIVILIFHIQKVKKGKLKSIKDECSVN